MEQSPKRTVFDHHVSNFSGLRDQTPPDAYYDVTGVVRDLCCTRPSRYFHVADCQRDPMEIMTVDKWAYLLSCSPVW